MPPKKEGPPLKLVAAILLSHMSLRGARDLMALLIIALLRTVSGHRLAKVQGNLFHAAYLRDKQGFLRLIIENLLLGFLQSTLFSTTKYIKGSLSLQFRKILTTLLHAPYFENMAYYKLSYVDGRIRNPEQRIASDVPRFCTELSEFLQENVMAAFDGVLYTWSLCSYASPKYIVWMLAYIFATGGLARRISPSFGMLMSKEQQLAGEYRQLHSRLRTHAESIAFYGGENREESHIQQKFKALIQHMGVVLHHNWWFGIAQDLIFRCLGAIVAGTLMIEPFFLGKLRPGSSALGRAETLSNLKYHSSVIIALFTSLGILFGNPMKIDRLRGYAGRIHELMTISKELSVNDASSLQRKGSRNYVTEANYIEFDGVKVVTPTGNVLVEDLTLKVESGSNLLVTGPNGSGKSSLFRVLGGLWPLMSGHLVKPGVGSDLNKEIFYVPQRPYTVVGTLRDQLIYPLTADEEVEPLTHDELVDLLKYVDLGYLLDRYPLEKEINWGDELSLGEQQRLGMARLFYHKPKFAILDECTSAVTSDMEERFCARVQAMGMSCITISHRPALVAFHDVVLSLDGEGGWKVQYKREDSAVRSTESGFDAMELSETDRQSDAMAVQRAFAMTKMDSLSSNAKSQSYISELTAASPPVSHGAPLPIIPQLQSASRPLISRVAAMFKILVPTMFDKQGAQILSVAILIGLTSLLGNTAGFLQGKTTKFVLEQDTTSYIRYFGAAMVLNFVSSFMSPSLRHLTSKLALEWRIRLTQHLLKHYFRKDDSSLDNNRDKGNLGVEDSQNLPEKSLATTVEEAQQEKFVKESTKSDGEVKKEESESNSDGKSNSGVDRSNLADGDSNLERGETRTEGGETNASEHSESEESPSENQLNLEEGKKPDNEKNVEETKHDDKVDVQTEEKIEENQDEDSDVSTGRNKMEDQAKDKSEILNETNIQNGPWSTQVAESENEKELQKKALSKDQNEHKWKICNITAGPDYIPCLDNIQAIRKLPSTMHYEHRERHCPDEAPTCIVALPEGYKRPIKWPKSREQIWYYNVPHTKLAEIKGHQNWVKVTGDYLTFPGGGTQFKKGALHYIDFIQESLPQIAWGKQSRVILDVGCGVASFGGYLFQRDALTMSVAPKDEHEAQVQFALERGIPAVSAVMGTKRLPFPSKVFDIVHCARCRVPWHIEGGKLLLELNRLLRPGGYFVWSATPVYRKGSEDVGIWKAMSKLTKSMCWDLVVIKKDTLNRVGAAIYRKPISNECYEQRPKNEPPMCKESDDPDAAWNILLQACIHKVSVGASERGSRWPEQWPLRVEKAPYWLKSSEVGVYGKAAPEDFVKDFDHWKTVVSMSYLKGLGISWSAVRNVMDMRAVYGGFAAALKDLNVWVMNVVPINSPDTLPIIYERGLFGMYHDWCESFSTYPRSYDLLHADHLFSDLKKRCKLVTIIAEVDRILRPEGYLIMRDKLETIVEVENLARSLQWKTRSTYSKDNEGLLCIQKTFWRPTEVQTIVSAIA